MALESIALIPSGYKANKLYCQLPVDGGADLTTSRASGATRVNKNGLIEDVATGIPRLDYTNGGCPELLLEPQSTNYVEYSEDMSNAVWTSFDVTSAPNTILDPSGSLTGCRLTALAGANRTFQQLLSFTASGSDRTYTGSLYIKSPNTTSCQIRVGAASSNTPITISSEWQRFDAQYLLGAGFTAVRLGVVLGNAGDIVDIAFGQVEELDYATSYIRNLTTGSTSRIADAVSGNSSLGQVINSSEGVLYFEGSALADDGTFRNLALSDGSSSNRVLFYFSSTINGIGYRYDIGGVAQAQLTTITSDFTQNMKVAMKYKENDFALWVNGVEIATDTSGSVLSSNTINRLGLDSGGGAGDFYGRIKELKVYDTALTDAELQTLTTL